MEKVPKTYPQTPELSAKTQSRLIIPEIPAIERFWDIYNFFSELVKKDSSLQSFDYKSYDNKWNHWLSEALCHT